ncbi:MAG TPA: carbohydrate kinase family protein [Terriglobia bacterium]|nr:carbohydrate kinase family protein [Terriglobia bacterium]
MDVLCLGILIADIFASPIPSLPAAGELRLVDRYLLSAGGCAANTAACLRRLGRGVGVTGKVGNDLFGDFVLADLERLGINAGTVKRSAAHPTSNTYIINVTGDDRRYLHCLGANRDFSLADVDLSAFEGARVLYFGGYVLMPGFQPQDILRLFRDAKKRGMITVLDVVLGAGVPVSMEWVEPALPYCDLFLPNEDEARALSRLDDPEEQAAALSHANPACTIAITLGRQGALIRRRGEVWRAPAYELGSIDESGAGDAFTAGFITGLLEDWPVEKTLRFASAVGASCTRALGCTEGVFRFDEALDFIAQNPLDIIHTFDPSRPK